MKKCKPDLVITDVRMPDLDGLEMLERLREDAVEVKAIVLSAYSEFSYAREAIKLGVSEYLLKPINVGDLTQALKNIDDRIENERDAHRKEGGATLEGVLYSIMLGGAKVDESLRSSLAHCCRMDVDGHFALAAVYLGRSYAADAPRIIELAASTLSRRAGLDWRIIEIPSGDRFSIVAFNIEDAQAIRDWFESCFMGRMKESGIPGLCVGWGRFDGLGALRAVSQGIDGAIDWSIALGCGSLIVWPEVEETQFVPLSYPIAEENEVRAALCAVNRERFHAGIGSFMERLREGGVHSPREMKSTLIRFFWSVLGTVREIHYDGYAAVAQQDILERIKLAVSWRELAEIAGILARLFPPDEDCAPNDGFVVARAKNIVREFYAQGITLNEVAAQIVHSGVGGINESDVMLATASKAIIIGFNVRPNVPATALAEAEGVDIRTYRVIYKVTEDVQAALVGLLKPEVVEEVLGQTEVRQLFKVSRLGTIAGCYVTSGKITRAASIRVLRDGVVAHDGRIASLKRFNEATREEWHLWLQAKYEKIERLNDLLGLRFWGQTVTSWDQVPMPMYAPAMHNPALLLDWNRFSSDTMVQFVKMQADVLHKHSPEIPVTVTMRAFLRGSDRCPRR